MTLPPSFRQARLAFIVLIAGLLWGWQASAAAETAQMSREETVTLLLEWLGVADASRQVNRRVEQLIAMEKRLSPEDALHLRTSLLAELSSEQVYQKTWLYMLDHYKEALMDDAVNALRQPLMLRMRELEQHARAREQINKLHAKQRAASREIVDSDRFALLARLDKEARTSELFLLLHSNLEKRVRRVLFEKYNLADIAAGPWQEQIQEQTVAQQQELIQQLVLNYSIYVYRDIETPSLARLVALMELDSLQEVLAIAIEGFAQALANPKRQKN
jgi:hypothetical protein